MPFFKFKIEKKKSAIGTGLNFFDNVLVRFNQVRGWTAAPQRFSACFQQSKLSCDATSASVVQKHMPSRLVLKSHTSNAMFNSFIHPQPQILLFYFYFFYFNVDFMLQTYRCLTGPMHTCYLVHCFGTVRSLGSRLLGHRHTVWYWTRVRHRVVRKDIFKSCLISLYTNPDVITFQVQYRNE